MNSRGADLDETWCLLHGFSRRIRISYSRGPTLSKNDKNPQSTRNRIQSTQKDNKQSNIKKIQKYLKYSVFSKNL